MNKPNLSALSKAMLPILAGSLLVGCNSSSDDTASTETQTVTVFYKADPTLSNQSSDSDLYQGLTLYIWNGQNDNGEICNAYGGNGHGWGEGPIPDGIDDTYGAYWNLPYTQDASQCIHIIPNYQNNPQQPEKPLNTSTSIIDLTQLGEDSSVYTQQGVAAVYPELIAKDDLPANTVRIYLSSKQDGDEHDFSLYVWNNDSCTSYAGAPVNWETALKPTAYSNTYGAYWDIETNGNDDCINIIPKNSVGYQTADLKFEFAKQGAIGPIGMVFKGTNKIFYQPLANLPQNQVELSGASAIFPDSNTLLIGNKEATSVALYYSEQGTLSFDSTTKTVSGFDKEFTSDSAASTNWQTKKPHLKDNFVGFSFDYTESELQQLLKGQLWLVASDSSGVIQVTEVQLASALDSLYADAASQLAYGALINGNTTTFRLWAPTAQSVKLIPYSADKQAQTAISMSFDTASGSWSAIDTDLKHGDFYRYQVTVYHPATNTVETYEVTDPYSLSLAINSEYSQVVDLSHSEVTPSGWESLIPIWKINWSG